MNELQIYLVLSVTMSIIFLIGTIHFALVSGELKEKVKAYRKILKQTDELFDFQSDLIDAQNERLKLPVSPELRKAFNNSCLEIERLKKDKDIIKRENYILTENLQLAETELKVAKNDCERYKARANHTKLPAKKVIDSDWWESITNKYPHFPKGNRYMISTTKKHKDENLMYLIKYSAWLAKDPEPSFLVAKSHFKPVNP